ncbi:hypothetical protein E1B28_012041 [Marasmius oreades]|uniref:Uncharacterized protein n=1 Tax=Marasmius oreades TaxID=181124 RepID=A0A9P7RQU1_9AGAR|nr:uncharacterized protein E1B28_012041 [Marasmius oreades]KAG7088002.1 hypothetical protein E1B28_012041 [Marasmius oreades]
MAFRRKPQSSTSTNKEPCPYCNELVTSGGAMTTHKRSCLEQQRQANELLAYRVRYELQSSTGPTPPRAQQAQLPTFRSPDIIEDPGYYTPSYPPYPPSPFSEPPDDAPVAEPPNQQTDLDDIMTQFHPASRRPKEQKRFEQYGITIDVDPTPLLSIPWRPFPTRFDFEVTDLALQCSMNAAQTKTFLQLLQQARDGSEVHMKNYDQVQAMWNAAADRTTRFQNDVIEVPFKGNIRTYNVLHRPLWNWIVEVVSDPQLVPLMEWDAPDSWWEAQTRINLHQHASSLDAKPLALIIYADKDKLSSFGTAKGYPVIAAIGNFPADARNGGGISGGRIVGWQPVIQEEAKHKKKKAFVDFKTVVWHEAALKMFESLQIYAEVGCVLRCGDQIQRLIFVILLILSADYEEQCIMCMIRGLRALHPCPKCMVEKESLSDLSQQHEARTPAQTTEVLERVSSFATKGEQEKLLKEYSLRAGKNVFMFFSGFDPYSAVSFDDLHFDDSGLWGAHLFPQLKKHLEDIGRDAETEVDRRFMEFPRWRNLNHFDTVTTISFNDGSKHRDVARMFLFAAEGVIKEAEDAAAYQLLICTRAYLNMTMYAGLHVQTTATLKAGRRSLQRFHTHISVYAPDDDELADKSWDFIKMHYHNHLFDDIQQKGALR